MDRAQTLGEQQFDRLPDQLGSPIAKEMLHLSVDDHDTPGGIDDHDRVGGGVEQFLKRYVG